MRAIERGRGLTRDLGGDGTTRTLTEAIIESLPRASQPSAGAA